MDRDREKELEELQVWLDAELEQFRQALRAETNDHFMARLLDLEATIRERWEEMEASYREVMERAAGFRARGRAEIADSEERRASTTLERYRRFCEDLLDGFMESAPPGFRIVESGGE